MALSWYEPIEEICDWVPNKGIQVTAFYSDSKQVKTSAPTRRT